MDYWGMIGILGNFMKCSWILYLGEYWDELNGCLAGMVLGI